jgi:hypothetical protein
VQTSQILQTCGRILKGEHPALSMEITGKRPLQIQVVAHEDADLFGGKTLRDLNDRKASRWQTDFLKSSNN